MERGVRSSVSSKRGGMGGQGYRKMEPTSKFGGTLVAPDLPRKDDNSLTIDPNLLVGPLYVPDSKADRIKEQLGDITQKLHSTLYAFDEYADYEEEEDPLLRIMRDQIGGLSDKDMQSKLNQFMDQYEDMHSQVSEANKDRDEMLLQLADWFTTDHVDLDDIKSSMDDTEEEGMKQSYFDTITNFEKIKKLQHKIVTAGKQGKSTKQLQKVKQELEKNVVDKFKVMKDMSMQTMKLKVSDDAPWKYAANEIVSMLTNVRAENAEEVSLITKKMQEMFDQLEKQALTIKSLTAELREKKEVVKKLTDENSDLSQDVAMFRARYARYEKDLESAKQLIKSLHEERKADTDGRELPESHGKSLSESISKVLAKIEEPAKIDVKQMSSDPALLRTQLQDYQEALESIRSEFSRLAEETDELKSILYDKKEYINNMEEENEKLVRDIRKLRQERRQSIAVVPAAGDGHKCEHCKCHIPEKEIDEEIIGLKKEVKMWQDQCNYFKKILADTEMKLSEAYKEISDLRMNRNVPMPLPPAPEPTPTDTPKPAPTAEEVSEKKVAEKKEKAASPKQQRAPKPKVRSRYMESSQSQRQAQPGSRLPPIDRTPIEQKIEEQFPAGLTAKQSRELKLYKAGDIQGKMNMLLTEIMEFVTEIGRMLYTEKDDDGTKIQSMKAFTFENSINGQNKQQKLPDPKEEEARQRKSQVMFIGQHACSKLKEAYDMLSHNLGLKHDEYEAIYRAYKVSQQRNNLRREVMMGRMPMSVLRDFDKQHQKSAPGADNLLNIYFNISYGGGQASLLTKQGEGRHGSGAHGLSRRSSGSDFEEESEAKLKNTMNVLSMQRSKSDLDHREGSRMGDFGLYGDGLNRERSQIYMTNSTDFSQRESGAPQANKQEMRMGMAVVPRKGLIHLSTNDEDTRLPMDDFSLHGDKRRQLAAQEHPVSNKPKGLIKRKDIMEHYRAGNKLLEESEAQKLEEEEMSKSLGNYTILDLQSKLLEMTDAKSTKRGTLMSDQEVLPSSPGKRKEGPPKDKPITLPAIKNINPFTMK